MSGKESGRGTCGDTHWAMAVIPSNMVILQGLVLAAEGGSTHFAGNQPGLEYDNFGKTYIDSGGTDIELWVLSWAARLLARCPLDQLDPPHPLLPACHTWWINPLLMINTPSHIPHLVRQFVEASGAWSTSSSTIIASALGFPPPWWICASPSIPSTICIAASDVSEKYSWWPKVKISLNSECC